MTDFELLKIHAQDIETLVTTRLFKGAEAIITMVIQTDIIKKASTTHSLIILYLF